MATKKRLEGCERGSIKADVIDKKDLINQHYYAIVSEMDAKWAMTKAARTLVKSVGSFHCGDLPATSTTPWITSR